MTPIALHQTNCPNSVAIAAQNDAFRRLACLEIPPAQSIRGRLHVTSSLIRVGNGFLADAIKATGEFDAFEPENDPEGWHDFGSIKVQGETMFWKLDLYETDSEFRYGAETPEGPETIVRVLTIMMASDW